MKCQVCGYELEAGMKFCINCGAPVENKEEIPVTEKPVVEGPVLETEPVQRDIPKPELVLEPSDDQLLQEAEQEAQAVLDEKMLDPLSGARPVAPNPGYAGGQAVQYAGAQAMQASTQTAQQGGYATQAAQQVNTQTAQQGGYATQNYNRTAAQPKMTTNYNNAGATDYRNAGARPYVNPVPTTPAVQPGHGTAVASLICGIASLVLMWMSMGFLGIPCAVAGLITSIVSKNAGNNEGIRTGGFVTSLIGLVLSILLVAACGILMELMDAL